jgi:hypothetical protein
MVEYSSIGSEDYNGDFSYIYKVRNNVIIKEWLFYNNSDELCSLECHENGNTGENLCIYLNNTKVYNLSDLDFYADIMINTKFIIQDHARFIEKASEYLSDITFNHRLKYGWIKKHYNFSLTVYKFKKIECQIKFNGIEYVFTRDQTLAFLKEYFADAIKYNPNYSLEREMNSLNLSDPKSQTNVKTQEISNLTNSIDKMTIEQQQQHVKKEKERDTSFLFITYPKYRKIEYQSCKKYDLEEIKFNNQINEISKLEIKD